MIVASLPVLAYMQRNPGVEFVLVDERNRPLTEISGNVEVQVQVDALMPTEEVYETIVYVTLKKPGYLRFWDSGNALKIPLSDGKLRGMLSKWRKEYPKGIGSAFVISTWVVDHEAGKVYRGFAVVNYNTEEIEKGFKKVVKFNLSEGDLPGNVSTQGSSGRFYYWKTDWGLSWVPSDYVRVPVLIVNNKHSRSGIVNAWVDIVHDYITGFGLTVAYGYKISEKETPRLDIYGDDFYSISNRFYFTEGLLLGPEQRGHIYIYAKPYHLHQREYYCTASLENCVPTGNERIQEGFNGVKTEGDRIVGGSADDLPDPGIMEPLLSGTQMSYATTLGVNDSEPLFRLISDASGSCSVDFGIGAPVGALAVALSGGAVPPWAAGLSAGIHYASSTSFEVYGGMQNYGEWSGTGENVPESIYMGVSRYTYHVGACDTKVPVGIYIEAG
ncbi:hypothetical protein [Thermococcus sp. P6]|uniref:hypothetical protein n=1 Tax=Thermococcus sp. P6 TaxID=122420 RepID=UPI001E58E8C5|nr:hypothetical protein [Thermococcus sp. P6]